MGRHRMATDAAALIDTSAGEATDNAYFSPMVDFLLISLCMFILAFIGAAVIIP